MTCFAERQHTELVLCPVTCNNPSPKANGLAYPCALPCTTAYLCATPICWLLCVHSTPLPEQQTTVRSNPSCSFQPFMQGTEVSDSSECSQCSQSTGVHHLLCIHQDLSELSHTLMQHQWGDHANEFVVKVRDVFELEPASA